MIVVLLNQNYFMMPYSLPRSLQLPHSKYFIAFVVLLVLLLLFSACSPGRFGLNKEEADYISRANKRQTVQIFHDKKAIKNATHKGVYYVKVTEDNICLLDTNTIKAKALSVAAKVNSFMNYKEQYEFIDVEFNSTVKDGKPTAIGDQPSCYYTLRIPLNNISVAIFRNSINTYDNASSFRR